jgi:hypothetical protein
MHYRCILSSPLHIAKGTSVTFSPTVEVSLACYKCRRAGRTILLSTAAPAAHFGRPADQEDVHTFDGRVVNMAAEQTIGTGETDLVTATYQLEFEFQPFEDAKHPGRVVSPQPTWGRIHMQFRCPCGCVTDTFTQTNLVRPRKERCECSRLLLVEDTQTILFSEATPAI